LPNGVTVGPSDPPPPPPVEVPPPPPPPPVEPPPPPSLDTVVVDEVVVDVVVDDDVSKEFVTVMVVPMLFAVWVFVTSLSTATTLNVKLLGELATVVKATNAHVLPLLGTGLQPGIAPDVVL